MVVVGTPVMAPIPPKKDLIFYGYFNFFVEKSQYIIKQKTV
jgi:hypothetical protein